MESKWAKIALLLVLIGFFIVFNYHYIIELTENTNSQLDFNMDSKLNIEIAEEEIIPRESQFYIGIIKELRQRADMINYSDWSDRNTSIIKIGEDIQYLLSSGYAESFVNVTSIGDHLSFYIKEYPLNSGILRRVVYTISYRTDGNERTETRCFLQYIGESTFFSNIEYVYNAQQESNLQVFENKSGIFIFQTFPEYYEQTVFSTNKKFVQPYITVYTVENDGFRVKTNVVIPLKASKDFSFKLTQQNGIIKGVVEDYYHTSECIFNASDLTFALPSADLRSEPVNYDVPCLLLGISTSNGEIRTLFIRTEDGKICVNEYGGQIIFTRKNELYSIKPYVRYEESYESTELYQAGRVDIKRLLCGALGVDLTEDFNKMFGGRPYWGYYEITDIPLYIGEDYMCYIQKSYESGGGTFRVGTSNIRFDKLDNLRNFKLDGWLLPNFKEVTLADLAYGAKASSLYKKDITTYGGNLSPYVDFRQLAVKRNMGKWSYMLPITEEYHHPGNGSYYQDITGFAAYDNNVSPLIDTEHEFIELGSWKNWDAKDIFRFPGSDVELVQNDYFIGISRSDSYNEYDISIPVSIDEYIVSISFIGDDKAADLNQYTEPLANTPPIGHNVAFWSKIHDELSGFNFQIQGENDESHYKARKLSIYYENEILQEFEFEYSEFIGYPSSYSEDFGFVIEDMNFDGYKDIRLIRYVPVAPNISYLCWVWDKELNMFVSDRDLEGLSSPSFDHENNLIQSNQRGSATDHYVYTYQYIDGELTKIKREETGYVNDKDKANPYLMEYQWIDGNWQLTKEEIIKL